MKVIELPQDRIDKVLSLSDPYDDFDYWSWTMSPIYRAEDEKVKATAGQFYDYGASKGIGHTPRAGSGNLHSGDKWNFCLTWA
ncbi:hypothetical protein [Rhizobium leguminosarum]|uniref:hypothetical protein n=1 Tax=Rhizobium leguminosarum TaxID=384 RepID=UPI001FE08871|nr:hypothetical protein [Rhizobium leguminosarum]